MLEIYLCKPFLLIFAKSIAFVMNPQYALKTLPIEIITYNCYHTTKCDKFCILNVIKIVSYLIPYCYNLHLGMMV